MCIPTNFDIQVSYPINHRKGINNPKNRKENRFWLKLMYNCGTPFYTDSTGVAQQFSVTQKYREMHFKILCC